LTELKITSGVIAGPVPATPSVRLKSGQSRCQHTPGHDARRTVQQGSVSTRH
jgi:hypothetical protein